MLIIDETETTTARSRIECANKCARHDTFDCSDFRFDLASRVCVMHYRHLRSDEMTSEPRVGRCGRSAGRNTYQCELDDVA